MKLYMLLCAAALILNMNVITSQAAMSDPSPLVWNSPSADAKGSMPIGNGDIGLNVWVEPSGDLVFLIGKTDSFDEFNRLLKLGRIRVRTTPALLQYGQPFTQTLNLVEGQIVIKTGTAELRVWVDANHPVVQVDVKSPQPIAVQATLEDWRTESRELTQPEKFSCWGNWPDKMRVNADLILPRQQSQIAWVHHNIESQWKRNLELTALGAEVANGKDPVFHRAFGAIVRGDGMVAISDTQLQTANPTTACTLQVFPLTQIVDTPQDWLKADEAQAEKVDKESTEVRLAAHIAWWREFWNRSWLSIDSTHNPMTMPVNAHPWRIGVASDGGSRFGGTITDGCVIDHALTADEITQLAAKPHTDVADITGKDAELKIGCTVAAWIKPAPGEAGRILDKCTAGHPDGITFDTVPGLSLRWIVGNDTMIQPACLKAGQWQHVAATVDGATGLRRIYLDGKIIKEEHGNNTVETLTRAYNLQRFVTACSGRGALPIKFNGSLFTVEGHDPDYRSWGGGFWFQNTREAYWAMLYTGDYDMMLPLFNMYRNALPLRQAATEAYYHHQGAFFPETIYFWGNYMDADNYGIDRKGKPDGLTDNTYIRRYWQSGLELVVMMLDYYDGTQDAGFRDNTLLPLAKSIVTFYDQHWPRGKDGKILFDPAQSLETWHVAKNPLPEIVGLGYIIPRLMNLPVDDNTKAAWRKTLQDLPPVPTARGADGVRLLPAETYSNLRNSENPELYSVFPYRVYTHQAGGEKEIIGRTTWNHRVHPEDHGWQQNCIQAALLGLTDAAKAAVTDRAASTAGYRFPGFFGPNYDWAPEQCHGTNMMTATQRMLMQCEGNQILLLPAWPKDWNVSFKLHAPLRTTVEGVYKNGKIESLIVTPPERRKDITIDGQPLPPE